MFAQVWNHCHASVCHLCFQNERGVSIDCLTGFKVNTALVTSHHVFEIRKAHKVQISFVGRDATTPTATMRIPYAEFVNDLLIGVPNESGHYAIVNIDFPEFDAIPGLTLADHHPVSIGAPVAMLAYNGGHANLSLRSGIISSLFSNSQGVRFIQFDGQTTYGNSGAPLIDPITFSVLGIVSSRNSSAGKAYHQLLKIIGSNLETLQRVENKFRIGDVDPIQVLIANQKQIKHLASNIYTHTPSHTTHVVMLDRILSYFNGEHGNGYPAKVSMEEAEYYHG